jgi:hypothetical protein
LDRQYKIIFSGLLKDRDYFKSQMILLGISEMISEQIINNAPVTLKKSLSLGEARRYADALLEAGGKVTIQAEDSPGNMQKDGGSSIGIITLKNFIMCPQCGQKQVKADTCIKCGFLL